MEKFGGKQNQISVEIQTLTEFSEFSKYLQYLEAYSSKSVAKWTKL